MFKHIHSLTLLTLLSLASIGLAQGRDLLVINGLGETMDQLDLDSGIETLNVATLGLFPNDILVRGDSVYVINSGSDEIQIFRRDNYAPLGTIFLGGGRNPWSAAWLSPDTLYVTNFVTSTLSKVDVVNQSIIAEYPIGNAVEADSPEGILIRDRRAFVCITSFNALFEYDGGKLEVYDLDADTLIAALDMGTNPQWLAEGHDGYLYVVSTGDFADIEGWLFKVDPVNLVKVDSLFLGGNPSSLAVTKQSVAYIVAGGFAVSQADVSLEVFWRASGYAPGATRVPDAGGLVFTVDLVNFQILHGSANPLEVDFGTVDVIAVSDSTVAICNFSDDTVTEIDSAGTILQRFNVGDGPAAIAKSPHCFVVKGDADANGEISLGDAVYIINFIFGGGPASPVTGASDADCNGQVSIGDAVFIINYIFGGGPFFGDCAD